MTTNRMRFTLIIIALFLIKTSSAQSTPDTLAGGIELFKDPRIDVIGRKMAEYNEGLSVRGGMKTTKGYRLMLLSTNDRNHAITVRSRLLQQFPDQKVYMVYQRPYIKLEFGNFVEKAEAEKYRKQISALGIIQNNIYTVPKTIEIKAEKESEED